MRGKGAASRIEGGEEREGGGVREERGNKVGERRGEGRGREGWSKEKGNSEGARTMV